MDTPALLPAETLKYLCRKHLQFRKGSGPKICHLLGANSPHLAGKPWFFAHPENQVHCDDSAFTPEFSERNSGSSFSEWGWTAGLMSAWMAKWSCKPAA
jgi:hypothetical protein